MSVPDKIRSDTQIIIPAGIHHIPEPIRISGAHIRIRGEEGAILRGTVPIPREDLRQEGEGLWSAPVSGAADALYVGDRKYTMARYPKADRPGEWYFDEKAMRIWLRPFPEDDLEEIEVSVSHGFFILAIPGQREPTPAKVLMEGSGRDAHSVCLDPGDPHGSPDPWI